MEQDHRKAKLIKEKKKSQRSLVYIPPCLIANGKKDDNPCHKCNAPNWCTRNRCKNKNIFLCEKSNTGEDNVEESSDAPSFSIESGRDETGKAEDNITPTLSVAVMADISQHQTLKLFGHIKNTKVTLLVDSGSTHNFIDSRVAK